MSFIKSNHPTFCNICETEDPMGEISSLRLTSDIQEMAKVARNPIPGYGFEGYNKRIYFIKGLPAMEVGETNQQYLKRVRKSCIAITNLIADCAFGMHFELTEINKELLVKSTVYTD
jgi:hypothetical protein